MKSSIQKIGFGGGCHWCTEAVFQSLIGILKVEQGFITSKGEYNTFSEAVIVHFDPEQISLRNLIEIHLYTHKSTSQHSMRYKYRSAVYFYNEKQQNEVNTLLKEFQKDFEEPIITKVLPFDKFKPSEELFHNYYFQNPNKPFCETYINPKLSLLIRKFSAVVNQQKLTNIEPEL